MLLILGFGVDVIILGILGLIGLAAAATELVFLFFAVRLLFSKRAEAVFSRIGRTEKGKYDVAFYNTESGELPNVFPAEMVMKKQLYKSDKTLKLRIDVKKKFVYDRNARLTILLGWLLILGIGSKMNSLAFVSSFIISKRPLSIMALPEKPRFITFAFSSRATIAGQAIPGREAEQPWAMDEP